MKNRKILLTALLVAAAGIAVMVAWPEAINAALDDFYAWFRSRSLGWR